MSSPSVGIVTDSTADLDPAVANELGITVVPLFVIFGDQRFTDGIELSHADFYKRVRAGGILPTTSQPTAASFEEAFRPHVEAGRPVVSVHISSKLSGTLNAARAGAQAFPGADIRAVDSKTCTGGIGLLARRAAVLANAGASADEIVRALEAAVPTQRGVCTVPDLSHVTRTGRVGKASALVGGLLKIVPVLRLDRGETEIEARVRTFARAKDALIDAIALLPGDPNVLDAVVMHADSPSEAASLAAALVQRLGAQPRTLDILQAGPVIGTHAGPGAVGIFALPG